MAFANFDYPADFINQICDGYFTQMDPTGKWFLGLIGANIRRGHAEIKQSMPKWP